MKNTLVKKSVLVVAGGSGSRMQSNIPKQFLYLSGKPVIVWTIEKFIQYNHDIDIVVVLPADQEELWERIRSEFLPDVRLCTVHGGPSRYASVKNGLNSIKENGLVAIHDGVRPLVSMETIQRCFEEAGRTGSAIPVIPVVETLRRKTGKKSITVNRGDYFAVQTPQVFRASLIKEAYNEHYMESFTDDASVFESAGNSIKMVDGNRENIKITTAADMAMAEALLGA